MKKSLLLLLFLSLLFVPATAQPLGFNPDDYAHVNHRGTIYPFELTFGLGLPQSANAPASVNFAGKPLCFAAGLRTDILNNLANVSAGLAYQTQTSDVQLSYAYFDLGLNVQELYLVTVGVNYSFWNVVNQTISGGLGYEVGLGAYLPNMSILGIKGVFATGNSPAAGNSFNFSLNSMQLYFKL